MKKNIAMRLASGLMLSCLLSTCVISGTFAKYTSTYTADDTATIAKWDINFKNDGANASETFTFDLFNTKLYDLTDGNVDTNKAEANIESKDGSMIAPGMGGYVTVAVENASDVTATYTITFDETTNDGDLPILYSLDNAVWKEVSELTKTQELTFNATGDTITLYWKWDYHTSDEQDSLDTEDGISGTAKVVVEATIVATQVD